jgi:hypothetical protein
MALRHSAIELGPSKIESRLPICRWLRCDDGHIFLVTGWAQGLCAVFSIVLLYNTGVNTATSPATVVSFAASRAHDRLH